MGLYFGSPHRKRQTIIEGPDVSRVESLLKLALKSAQNAGGHNHDDEASDQVSFPTRPLLIPPGEDFSRRAFGWLG